MNAENKSKLSSNRENRGRWITGLAFIALGLLWLAQEFVEIDGFGAIVLPGLAVIFLLWGIVTRSGGLLIPGGILAGIGTGVWLMSTLPLEGSGQAGVFLLSFAGGWGLITLLSAIFTDETQWWALIPGGIMTLIGGALMAGGVALDILSLAGRFWPVILIVIGISVLLKRR
ncbi:MAG: hypothetical protein HC806_09955 [Anaerolineae bacterium]|nr:hypothetical protein [Anaerolineae bacterium]